MQRAMEAKTDFEEKKDIPIGLRVVSILLLIDGVFALLGCLASGGQDLDRVYGAASSIIIIITSILILINHKRALPFSFLCAAALTIDLILEFFPRHFSPFSLHTAWQIARTLFNVTLYWVGFLWYRKWRTNPGKY
jgi:hypothetical protein